MTIRDRILDATRRDPSGVGRAWRFIRDNLAVTLTLSGLLVYTSLRLSAGIFYGRFGFTPEDVGLGYAEILARSLYTLILLTVYGGLLIFATLWVAGALGVVIQRWIGALPRRRVRGVEGDPRAAGWAQYLALWPALTAVAVLAVPIFNAAIEADSVETGRPVRQSDWLLPFAWDAPAASSRHQVRRRRGGA